MPGQIFAGAVQNDVGSEFDGTQKYRRQESVVDDQEDMVFARDSRHRPDIGHVHQRIGRRFDEDRFRFRFDQGFDFGRVGSIGPVESQPVFDRYLVEETIRSTVQVIGCDDMVTWLEHFHQARGGCHAGSEGERLCAPFQFRHSRFQRVTRGVGITGVVESGAFAQCGMGKSRGLVDRRRDGTAFVGVSPPAMDTYGFQFHCSSLFRFYSVFRTDQFGNRSVDR